jgi:DNA-binding transcriptional regulator YiaG
MRPNQPARRPVGDVVSIATSGKLTIQPGEGIQAGGWNFGGRRGTVLPLMSVTVTATSGRGFFDKLTQRLGRAPTVEDLVGAVARELQSDRRKLRVRKTIAVRIRDARRAKELTQADLGALLRKPDKHVNRWEHAHRPAGRTPSDESRAALAAVLGLPLRTLYPEGEPDEDLVELTAQEEDELL